MEEERREQWRQQIEQMKREKALQLKRRQQIKKIMPYIGGGICLLAVVIGVLAFAGKPDKQEQNAEAFAAYNMNLGVSAVQNTIANMTRPKEEPAETVQVFSANVTDSTESIGEEIVSSNAVMIELDSHSIIARKAETERVNPASMTKVLTVLVAAEQLGDMSLLDDTFTMTIDITDYSFVNGCSNAGFEIGETITVRDLFYGTVLPSGGDAAVGLATYIAGSHENFVALMNEKLDELGLSDTAHFTNCVGLYDEEHYCTVYDMAMIMEAALQNELCREVLSAHTYTTSITEQHPEGIPLSNWFLRRIEDKETGGLVVCGKTGYVIESGNCAVSYGTGENGKSFICVTTGATSVWKCIYDHADLYKKYMSL